MKKRTFAIAAIALAVPASAMAVVTVGPAAMSGFSALVSGPIDPVEPLTGLAVLGLIGLTVQIRRKIEDNSAI